MVASSPHWRPGRWNVDISRVGCGSPDYGGPLSCDSHGPATLRASRDQRRAPVGAVDVDVVAEGRPAARVSVLLVAAQGTPPGRVWGQGTWGLLPPEGLEPAAPDRADTVGYPELHFESAGLGDTTEPLRAWLRDRWPLVDGEAADRPNERCWRAISHTP